MVPQSSEIDRLNSLARQSFGPNVNVANPRLFSDFITQAAAAFEEQSASPGQVTGAGPPVTPGAMNVPPGIDLRAAEQPRLSYQPLPAEREPQGMGLLATPSPMDLERRRLIALKFMEGGLTPPTWASTDELEAIYALRAAPTPLPVEGQVGIPSVEEQHGLPFMYRLGRLGEFVQRAGQDTWASLLAKSGMGPSEFRQALEEERALGPRLGEIDPQTFETRALQRTSSYFPQIPILPGIPGVWGGWTLGLGELGSEVFNPFNLPPLGAARAVVRGAGVVRAVTKAITKEAAQEAVGAAGRRVPEALAKGLPEPGAGAARGAGLPEGVPEAADEFTRGVIAEQKRILDEYQNALKTAAPDEVEGLRQRARTSLNELGEPPTGAAAVPEVVGGIPERPRVATAFDTGIAAPEQINVLKAANNPPPPVREAEGLVTGRTFSEADIEALVAVRNNLPVSAETQGVLATEKLTRLLRQAEVATEETIRLRAEELRGITARAAGAAEAVSPRGAGRAARGQLGGERALGQFEPLRPQFTDDDLNSLFGRIWGTDDRFFTKLNADTALTNLLQGHIPTPSELRLLRERFGPELVRAARDLRPLSQRVRENVIEVLNIPQLLRSSFDFSAPLRQGILLSAGHPREFVKSFVPMFRAAFNPAEFRRINANIVAHPDFDRLVNEGGLFLHDVEGTIGLALREEAFMGRILQRIPVLGAGIKASERGFATYLNKLRFDVATNTLDNWRSAGIEVTPDRVRRMNRWLNVATGRGRLGKFESIGPELNAAFWSPRLVMSRIQAPLSIFERDPVIRKMVVGDLLKFFGAGMAILGLIKASNAAEVELNPRSSDFGKVRVGPSRVEFWGGMQPIARYLAQAVSGSRKTVTGEAAGATVPQPPSDTIIRFLRSKLAPGLPSIVANRVFQETFIGEDLDEASGLLTEEYGVEVTAEQRELFGQLVPLIIVDILEGVEEQGLLGGAIGATSLFGTGTTAFGGPTGTQGRGGPVAKEGIRSAVDPRHFIE